MKALHASRFCEAIGGNTVVCGNLGLMAAAVVVVLLPFLIRKGQDARMINEWRDASKRLFGAEVPLKVTRTWYIGPVSSVTIMHTHHAPVGGWNGEPLSDALRSVTDCNIGEVNHDRRSSTVAIDRRK